MPRFGLGRERRLRKTGDYQELQKRGRRLHSTHFNLVYLPRKSGGPRLGLMVSKKVGKAHDRNRVKRWVREFFRLRQHELREGLDASLLTDEEWGIDLAVAAKPGAAELDHVEAERELAKLFKRLVAETKKRDETRVTEK